jgi:hypothetical protein
MDVASKIKLMKEKAQQLEQEIVEASSRIKELSGLVEANKNREVRLADLAKKESELLASF